MNKKLDKTLNLFWIGFTIYTLGFTISITTDFNFKVCQSLQLFGIVLFVTTAIMIIHFKFENNNLKIIYILYCSWLFITILRGFRFDYESIKLMLFDAWLGIFPYFAPLILLFPKNISYLKKVINVIIIFAIFYFILDLFYLKDLLSRSSGYGKSTIIIEFFSRNLSIPCGFILFTFLYHSKKIKIIALLAIILTFLLATIRARRGTMFLTLNILICYYFIYYHVSRGKVIVIIFSSILIPFIYFFGAKLYEQRKTDLFSLITHRLEEDTRSGVTKSFYQDMDTKDWILGRGINGQYYCPVIRVAGHAPHRSVVETGFLQIILKGGLISLVLLLIITIPALYKGLFHSKNILSKAAGIWILLWLINLYPAVGNTFTLQYLLVWISIGICYDPSISMKTDEEIKNIFKKN